MKLQAQKVFSIVALSAMLITSAACSSAPTQDEAQAPAAAVEEIPAVDDSVSNVTSAPTEAAAVAEPTIAAPTAPAKDLSLGASSSGRGH